jgi:G:T-mismatch repair DNA endonuclease (very short patch repair protein)
MIAFLQKISKAANREQRRSTALAEWGLQALKGCEVQLTAQHSKAGMMPATLKLGN